MIGRSPVDGGIQCNGNLIKVLDGTPVALAAMWLQLTSTRFVCILWHRAPGRRSFPTTATATLRPNSQEDEGSWNLKISDMFLQFKQIRPTPRDREREVIRLIEFAKILTCPKGRQYVMISNGRAPPIIAGLTSWFFESYHRLSTTTLALRKPGQTA